MIARIAVLAGAVLVNFAVIAFVTYQARRRPSVARRSSYAYKPQLIQSFRRQECPHCSGGTQHLNGEAGWGKIPKHIWAHYEYPDHSDCEHRVNSPNVRKCPHCAGFGEVLVPRDRAEAAGDGRW